MNLANLLGDMARLQNQEYSIIDGWTDSKWYKIQESLFMTMNIGIGDPCMRYDLDRQNQANLNHALFLLGFLVRSLFCFAARCF